MSGVSGRADVARTRWCPSTSSGRPGRVEGRRRALVAGAATALAALAGCTGGAALRPVAAGGEEIARVSVRLESMQFEQRKLGEKLDRLEKLLEAPAAASPAAAVARPAGVPANAPAAAPSRTLRPAIVADEFTLKVQKALKAADCDPGPPDGKKGRRTTTALRKFQRENSLPETGMADEATWVRLKRHLD